MDIYQTLGDYYDDLVGDEQAIDQWEEWIESFKPGKKFLELACGSGEITRRLAEHHTVTALDLSSHMLERARRKSGFEKIEWLEADMQDLSGLGTYDAIGCFCDSFNYLIEEEAVRSFFSQVAAHLHEGGLFLFDSHGKSRLQEFEEEYEEAGEFSDGTQVQWIISAADDLIYQDFAFYFPQRTVQEHHLQRVWDPDWLKECLSEHFEVLSLTGDFGQEPLEECEKYFFACRKKPALSEAGVRG